MNEGMLKAARDLRRLANTVENSCTLSADYIHFRVDAPIHALGQLAASFDMSLDRFSVWVTCALFHSNGMRTGEICPIWGFMDVCLNPVNDLLS